MEELNKKGETQELEEFRAWKEEKAKALRRTEERAAYKSLVDEAIEEVFPTLTELSTELSMMKKGVRERFADALKIKQDIYNVKGDQRSDTFSHSAGGMRIVLGYYQADDYDDTVNEGIAKVKAYISGLAKDKESSLLVDAVMRLLARDQKGNLKASRVMQLRKLATDSGDAEFLDGVKIIEDAYRPAVTKTFVRAELRDGMGGWKNVPLGMTEAG